MPICKLFNSPSGCAYGAGCRFEHHRESPETVPVQPSNQNKPRAKSNQITVSNPLMISAQVQDLATKKVVTKQPRLPVPRPVSIELRKKIEANQDPATIASLIRSQQIEQLKTRFNATTTITFANGDTKLSFSMKPTDPDFPYELEQLNLTLTVPEIYPTSRKISVYVANTDIPVHMAEILKSEIERACRFSTMSLLEVMKWTDRELEKIFQKKEVEDTFSTMQFLNFKDGIAKPLSSREQYYGGDEEYEIKSESEQESDEYNDPEVESEVDQETEEKFAPTASKTGNYLASGTHIRIQDVSLTNISLYYITMLSLAVRCLRCKTEGEFRNLLSGGMAVNTCLKCSAPMQVKFFHELGHASSNSLGRLELEGCVSYDLLPSEFLLNCEGCDQGLTMRNVHVGSTSNNCRKCHLEMSIFFSSVKLLQVRQTLALKQSKKKPRDREMTGISKGDPLPRNGICAHYKRSFRWFRFPCCGKIFPCDVCHEDNNKDGHEMQWATKMICGYCSKEQQYSQKPCSCGKSLIGKTNAFWNAGKGMRDQSKMDRNERKKYAGLTKTTSNKKRNSQK